MTVRIYPVRCRATMEHGKLGAIELVHTLGLDIWEEKPGEWDKATALCQTVNDALQKAGL